MANIMQYLIQLSDESRDYYQRIDKRVDEILDKLALMELRLVELEQRVNLNRNSDSQ